MKKLTRSIPVFLFEMTCIFNFNEKKEKHFETFTILESSHVLSDPTGCKRMVWEVMILSLYSKKLSFMWLLLQWAHWLTACCLDLWASGKKAGGRLGDKSKTDWGRTDDLPRTVLKGHVHRRHHVLEWWLKWVCLIYQVPIAHVREHEIWFNSQCVLKQTLKISNTHEIMDRNGAADIGCNVLYREQNLVPYAINYCSQGLLMLGY